MKNLKTLFITLAVLCFFTSAYAQKGAYFGPKIGVNLTNLSGDNVTNSSSIVGTNAGLAMHLGITQSVAIAPELLYSMKGAQYKSNPDLHLNYFEIPVLFRYSFGHDVRPYLNLGPYLGVLLNAKQNGTDVKKYYNSSDIGFDGGAGILVNIGGGQLMLDFRYGKSLSSIGKDQTNILGQTYSVDIKNTALQLSVAFLIGSSNK